MRFHVLSFLVLLTFTQCYVWVRKKKEKRVLPVVTVTKTKTHESRAAPVDVGPPRLEDTTTLDVFHNGDWSNGSTTVLTREECLRSVDLGEILCPRFGLDSTCALFSAVGTRVISCQDLRVDNSVFLVPPGKFFMLPTKGVGYVATMDHISAPGPAPIELETLSEWPRVFRLRNFVSAAEVEQMLNTGKAGLQRGQAAAKSERGEALKSKEQGETTQAEPPHPYRTADLVYDIASPAAVAVKQRLFDLLGLFPFQEALTDGFQTLRYNVSGAYLSHMDWLEPSIVVAAAAMSRPAGNVAAAGSTDQAQQGKFSDAAPQPHLSAGDDSSSSKRGSSNRYATLLLYLTDVQEGGETVFTEVSREALARQRQHQYQYPMREEAEVGVAGEGRGKGLVEGEGESKEESEVVALLEQSLAAGAGASEASIREALRAQRRAKAADAYMQHQNASHLVAPGSWQRDLLGHCRTHLTARPVRGEALLFYSQTADGGPDYLSRHGACPVIRGEKWVSNLWVWSGPRDGSPNLGALTGVSASFESVDVEGAQLFWEDQLWEGLSPGRPVKVNTFAGHRWRVSALLLPAQGGPPLLLSLSWVIREGRPTQRFVVSMEALLQAHALQQ